MSLNQEWIDLCLDLTRREEICVAGVQRIHSDVIWELNYETLMDGSINLQNAGYTDMKIKQLIRNYYNADSLERCFNDVEWRIDNRKYGSGVMLFRGEQKKGTKQDYCMTSMTISYYPNKKYTLVNIDYRTAEAIKRFRGDLIFLRTIVMPKFEVLFKEAPVRRVRFHFTNITLHPMYWVLLIAHTKHWKHELDILKERNYKMFRTIMYWCWRYLLDESQSIDKYSAAKQVRVIAERITENKRLRAFRKYVKHQVLENTGDYSQPVKEWRDAQI